MADALRIMLVDDHYLVRMGLTSVINLEPDMTICAEAATGEQAIAMYGAKRPDVTLMDLRLPGMNGADTIQAIRREVPDARFVMLSTYVCDEEIYGALQAGAMAYLVKPFQKSDLVPAIEIALSRYSEIAALEAEVAGLTDRLETRKSVERAKGELMTKYAMTEPQAFKWIQRTAMDHRMTMREVADRILAEQAEAEPPK